MTNLPAINPFQDDLGSSLDIGPNPVSHVSKAWVRADYIMSTSTQSQDMISVTNPVGFKVAGQPGIWEYGCLYFQDTLLIVDKRM